MNVKKKLTTANPNKTQLNSDWSLAKRINVWQSSTLSKQPTYTSEPQQILYYSCRLIQLDFFIN